MKKTKKEFLYDLKDWYFETLGLGRWSGALPLKKAPKKYLDDEKFIRAAIKIDAWSYMFASKRLRNELSIVKLMYKTEASHAAQIADIHDNRYGFPKKFWKNKVFLDWLGKNNFYPEKFLKHFYKKINKDKLIK
jgi:hypothetical protein